MSHNPRHLVPPAPGLDPGPGSLAEEVAEAVDDARAIHAELGLRPYRVAAVRVHWSGGQVGRGDVTEVHRLELLPRPKVEFRARRELSPAGVVDRSTVVLSELSVRLTEDDLGDLLGLGPLGAGDESYFEIWLDGRDGRTERRRYVPSEPPERRAFEWRMVLRAQHGGPDRSGRPRYPGAR